MKRNKQSILSPSNSLILAYALPLIMFSILRTHAYECTKPSLFFGCITFEIDIYSVRQ